MDGTSSEPATRPIPAGAKISAVSQSGQIQQTLHERRRQFSNRQHNQAAKTRLPQAIQQQAILTHQLPAFAQVFPQSFPHADGQIGLDRLRLHQRQRQSLQQFLLVLILQRIHGWMRYSL